jgi:hypothetical protein
VDEKGGKVIHKPPTSKARLSAQPRNTQRIDFQSIKGGEKLSTPPTATTNFFSKTEQQA